MMKRLNQFFFIVGFIVIISSCKKTNNDIAPAPPPNDKYSVSYEMKMNGSYDSLIISFIDSTQTYQQLSDPDMPWQMNYDNFKKGDSVYCDISFITNSSITYDFLVAVTKEGHSYNGGGSYHSISHPDTTLKINVSWGCKIE
ncbi:MAG: hypothetical protein H8D45_23705 [Bacteroidetes bacterium]|nr:hypothetical protein [Bacteroidota bacterium]MBL7105911.1 hypothetical protein [Bacteroidales bacterium]